MQNLFVIYLFHVFMLNMLLLTIVNQLRKKQYKYVTK